MTEVRLKVELRRPRLGLGRFRCANVPCRAILVNAEQIGVLAAGPDEIVLCPACARRLIEQAGPQDRPAETLLLDDADRARQARVYAGLLRLIGRRFGGFSLAECDDGAVQVVAATADLSRRIEAHLAAAGVVCARRNAQLLEVRSEDGLAGPARPARPALVTIGREG